MSLLKANIRGNESFPQRYFGIIAEVIAEACASEDPIEALRAYLLDEPSTKQLGMLAEAGTRLHEKYQIVDYGGKTIRVPVARAQDLFYTERRHLLSFLLLAISETSSLHFRPAHSEAFPDQDKYREAAQELISVLKQNQTLVLDLQAIFKAIRFHLHELHSATLAQYKEDISRDREHGLELWRETGTVIRDKVLHDARTSLRLQPKEYGRQTSHRKLLVEALTRAASTAGL